MTKSKNKKQAVNLDPYESDLEKNIDKAKPLSRQEKSKHMATLQKAASNYGKKDKRINIRVYGADLEQIKEIAAQEGLPYQTLITSVLHKFATGQFSSNRPR